MADSSFTALRFHPDLKMSGVQLCEAVNKTSKLGETQVWNMKYRLTDKLAYNLYTVVM